MTFGELLSELRENILHDRSDRVAGHTDYLWTDDTLKRYINIAQRRFARESLILRDATSHASQVYLKTGEVHYPLDASVLGVLSAKLDGDTADLSRAGHATLNGHRMPDRHFRHPSDFTHIDKGRPLAFSTDDSLVEDDFDALSVIRLRVYPEPDAQHDGSLLRMRVVRLPLYPMEQESDLPEIPEDHQLEMLDWAAYLALRIVDDDAGFPKRAEEFRQMFNLHVRRAREVALRKMFAPKPWGFGNNGWSWERD